MTDDISTYAFDFEKEAKALLADAQRAGRDLLIVETEAIPHASGNAPQIDFHRAFGNGSFRERLPRVQKEITQLISQNRMLPPYHGLLLSRWGLGKARSYIAFHEEAQLFAMLGEANKSLMKLFFLQHEAGHGLIFRSPRKDIQPLKESAADAYAALRLLQRFGQDAVPLLSQLSWFRANQAVAGGDTTHLTTTVLDKIILDNARRDLSTLTHAEIIRLAGNYARDLTPKARVLSSAEKVFAGVRKNMPAQDAPDIANVLATSSLAAQPDNFSFYILAKYAQPFFLAPEKFIFNGAAVKPKKAAYHAQMQAQTEARLWGLRLSDVFNRKALTPAETSAPLADAVKVVPAAEQPFIYQPKKFRHLA